VRHLSRPSLVVPIVAVTERDIQFSLRLDQLAARIDAAEAALRALREEYAELLAARFSEVDDDNEPQSDGEWLGHALVEQATQLLRPAN
jgi:hypothetical protein